MNKTIFGLCLMAGLSLSFGSCSSDSDDNNIDVNVKPSGNWYTTSGFSGVQLMTYSINSKDSSVCVITVEDTTKNDTVYTMVGGVSSFKAPVTTVTFPSSTDGPQKATLTYQGNKLAVQITGGKTKINDFTVLNTNWNGNLKYVLEYNKKENNIKYIDTQEKIYNIINADTNFYKYYYELDYHFRPLGYWHWGKIVSDDLVKYLN